MKTIVGQMVVFTCDRQGCRSTLRTHCNSNAKKYARAMGWLRCLKAKGEENAPRLHYCHRCREKLSP